MPSTRACVNFKTARDVWLEYLKVADKNMMIHVAFAVLIGLMFSAISIADVVIFKCFMYCIRNLS